MNLVQEVLDRFGPDVAMRLSKGMGLSASGMQGALSGAVPAVIGALISRAGDAEGAGRLHEAAAGVDGRLLDRLAEPKADLDPHALSNQGATLLDRLIGEGSAGELVSALASTSGMSRGAMRSVVGVATPVVLAVVRRAIRSEDLDADGLRALALEQREPVARAVPKTLADTLARSGVLGGLIEQLGLAGTVVASAPRAAPGSKPRPAFPEAAAERQRRGPDRKPRSRGGRAASGSSRRAAERTRSPSETARRPERAPAKAAPRKQSRMLVWGLPVLIVLTSLGYVGWRYLDPGGQDLPPVAEPVAPEPDANAPSPGAAPTPDPAVAVVDPGDRLETVAADLTDRLADIATPADAEAALPDLRRIGGRIEELTAAVDGLGGAPRVRFADRVRTVLPRIREAIDDTVARPGIGERLRPVLEPMAARLRSFTEA